MIKRFKKMIKDFNAHKNGGFSLVELSIAITCIGLLLGGTLFIVNSTKQTRYAMETRSKMETIADHLSSYAQLHDRLPCPADPIRQNNAAAGQALHYGDERVDNIPATADQAADCFDNGANSHGLIPYRALGLEEEYARDAWGRHFTYVVSPVAARYNNLNAADTTINRNVEHYVSSDPRNSLTPKFRFCNGMATIPNANGVGTSPSASDANDLQYNDPDPYVASLAHDRGTAMVTVLNPANPDILYANDYVAGGAFPHPHTRYPAFALISHGPNGYGAYLADETTGQFLFTGTPASEESNARVGVAGANTIFNREFNDNPAAAAALQFDDIVMVQTQDQIFARKGGQSCVTP